MDNHLYVHRNRTEHAHVLYIVRNPEATAHPEASPGVHHKDDAIAIVQKPDPDPDLPLVAEPDLAVAVEVVAVTIAGAKVAHLLPTLALQEVPRSW